MFKGFRNKVKIKKSPETKEKGLVGKIGTVYGITTPSATGVEIIGTPKEDYAINVYFDELETSYWFDEDLLEQVEDGKGTVITLEGISKEWIKRENGDWIEERDSSSMNQS